MLFNIETDTGDTLRGYVVPDSFTATPGLCVIGRGQLVWSGLANEERPALVAAGRHETGQCGFCIGPEEVPGLSGMVDAELRDLSTGLTLYRRRPGPVPAAPRLFRLETRLLPLRRFDSAMEGLFQGWYPRIERLGAETVAQIFLLGGLRSLYVSGRVQMPAHAEQIERGFATAVLLRDPYEELAERLLALSGGLGPVGRLLGDRDRMIHRAALSALEETAPEEPRALRRFMRRLDRRVAAELSNPLTRLLTAREASDLCSGNAVSVGLRTLSGIDIVATTDHPGEGEAATASLLDVAPIAPVAPPVPPAISRMADELAGMGIVEAMLECDLEIYANVSSVLARLSGGSVHVGTSGPVATSGAAVANSA